MFEMRILLGRLTRDPETRQAGQNTVTRFSMAVNRGYGEKKVTEFVQVSAWGKLGNNVQQFTSKGSIVLVLGKTVSSKKDDKTYYEVNADEVQFISSAENKEQQPNRQQQPQQGQQPPMQPQFQQQQFHPNYQQPQQQFVNPNFPQQPPMQPQFQPQQPQQPQQNQGYGGVEFPFGDELPI